MPADFLRLSRLLERLHLSLTGVAPDQHHAQIHGVAQHTDVTRTLFIPCGNYTTGIVGESFVFDVVFLATGVDKDVHFGFMTPSDFVSFSSLRVVWRADAGVAGQDWVCDPSAYYYADGEACNTHIDTPVNTTIDATALDTVYVTDVGFTLASLALGDFVGVKIVRLGTDGADTLTGNVRVYGLLLTYVAEQ